MKLNLSTVLVLFTSLTFVSPAFAEDDSAKPEQKPLYAMQITQEGAIKFPYSEPSKARWNKSHCVGSYTPNPEIAKAYDMEVEKDPETARRYKMPTAFDVCFVPVREGSGLRLSGVIIAYDYNGKFLTRDMFSTFLPREEVFTKRIFAAGRYYEFNLKFFY